MLSSSGKLRLATLVATLFIGARVDAQSRTLFNSAQIPRDFVVALLMTEIGPSEAPDLLIGEVPPLLASRLVIPSGARILGTIIRSGSSSALYESALPSDSLRAVIEAGLPARGWIGRRQYGSSSGGFQPARSRVPVIYCSDENVLDIVLVNRAGRGTLAALRVREGMNECAPKQEPAPYPRSSMPLLAQPQGSNSYSSCEPAFRSSYSSGTQATLETSLSTAELMNHYGRQLGDSGWKLVTTTGEEKLTRSWERSTSTTVERTTITIVTKAARPECKALSLEISGRTP